MFRVFIIAAWAVLLVILLYLWADVREISGIVKESKRELLRSNLSVRAAESYPNFQEERDAEEGQKAEAADKKSEKPPLSASEERVLDEVLTEFLG